MIVSFNNKVTRLTAKSSRPHAHSVETAADNTGPRYTLTTDSAHTYNNKQRRIDRAIDMLIYHIETRHIVAGPRYTQLTSSAHT